MVHVAIRDNGRTRHEYWDEEKWNLPFGNKARRPEYVCYTYEKITIRYVPLEKLMVKGEG